MTKWEYYLYRFIDTKDFDTLANRIEVFENLGSIGWELISVDNEIAYFKRMNKEYEQQIIQAQSRKLCRRK